MKVHRSSQVRATASPALKSSRLLPLRRAAGALVVAAGLMLSGLAVPAEAATVYKAPLRTAVRGLVVAAEVNAGYDRDRYFGVWRDTNGDCQNTRQEVLVQESRAAVSYTSRGCTASTGRCVTSWDNRVHTSASTVQIDHTVPVHEAWGSGARYCSQARRVAFYNDRVDNTTVAAQAVEEWTLINPSPMDHPFHLHVWPMQVIEDRGQIPGPPVWRDIVNVPANGEVKVRIMFKDFTGRSVYHCHILDHEDQGMMGVIEVQAPR